MSTALRNCCLYGIGCTGGESCDVFYQSFCSETEDPPRVLTNQKCQDWVARSATTGAADTVMRAACDNVGALATYPECRYWCSRPENAGKCNIGASALCLLPNFRDDEFCKCINVPASIKFNPKCIWSPCFQSKGAYLTAIQADTCPNIVDCSVVMDLRGAADNILNNVRISQDCRSTLSNKTNSATQVSTTPSPTTPSPTTPIPTTPSPHNDSDNLIIYTVIAFCVIIMVIISAAIVFFILRLKKSNRKNQSRK